MCDGIGSLERALIEHTTSFRASLRANSNISPKTTNLFRAH